MTNRTSRSYENLGEGQQLYRVVSYCSDAETLWGKIESGKYDWLGVVAAKKEGGNPKFLVGTPPRLASGAFSSHVAKHDINKGIPSGANRVVMAAPSPHGQAPSESHWHTAEEARAAFARVISDLADASGSGLHRVKLYVDDQLENQEFVVRPLPNLL